jgi:AraC-like DNA-binding protein
MGDPRELPFVVESLGVEQRVLFREGDSWCRATTIDLRSGIRLGVTTCRFEPSFSFLAEQPASDIELVVSRGAVLHTRAAGGSAFRRGGNTLQLSRSRRPVALEVRPADEGEMECVSLSMSTSKLAELLGVAALPDAFRSVSESDGHAPASYAMTPGLFRLLDEIVNVDARGASRLLWYEAKGLELVARMTDELAEAARYELHPLSAHDVERLEHAHRVLVERLDAPPTISELARAAGFSETKLKVAFRRRFGTSIFDHLRQVRMEEARRLLLQRRFSVSEVAQRVGYSNPSKFAAAFRRQFGVSPSVL